MENKVKVYKEKDLIQRIEELEAKCKNLENMIENLVTNSFINNKQADKLRELVKNKAIERLGNNTTDYKLYARSYKQIIWNDFNNYFGCDSYKELLMIDYDDAIKYIKEWKENENGD